MDRLLYYYGTSFFKEKEFFKIGGNGIPRATGRPGWAGAPARPETVSASRRTPPPHGRSGGDAQVRRGRRFPYFNSAPQSAALLHGGFARFPGSGLGECPS